MVAATAADSSLPYHRSALRHSPQVMHRKLLIPSVNEYGSISAHRRAIEASVVAASYSCNKICRSLFFSHALLSASHVSSSGSFVLSCLLYPDLRVIAESVR